MSFALTLCLLSCLANPVLPQAPSAPLTEQPAVVQIQAHGGQGQFARRYDSSGTYVARYANNSGLVLTAAHVLDGASGRIDILFPDGQRAQGQLLAASPALDVAAIKISPAPQGVQPLPLGDQLSDNGEQVELWGYGPSVLRGIRARTKPAGLVDADKPGDKIAALGYEDEDVTVVGDSGGPAIQAGKVVGVHCRVQGRRGWPRYDVEASADYGVYTTPCQRIRQWLHSRLPGWVR